LIQKLAEFLEIIPIRITAWMWPEPPNQDGQSDPSQAADSDQSNGHNQPYSLGENDPINSAKTAQSITDSPSQTQQHKPDSDVIDHVQGKEMQILGSMGEFGIGFARSMELLEAHGVDRIESVIQHAKTLKRHNLAGNVIRALTENWKSLHQRQICVIY